MGFGKVELTNGGPRKLGEMRSRSEGLSQIVCYGANVSARSYPAVKVSVVAIPLRDFEFFNLNLFWPQLNRLFLAGQFVRRNAGNLLGRKWWRKLLQSSDELGGSSPQLVERELHRLFWARGLAVSVICIGGKAKTNGALIAFVCIGIELGKPREAS